MIQLFLNNKEIFIPSSQTLKLTRQNPYISSSGDYTFDVQAPLSIAANREFFGPWHRVESTKLAVNYTALLYANNICVLNGSAKITSITESYVKLQLYGDQSEFNAVFGDLYVDELPLPYLKDVSYGAGTIQGSGRRGTSSVSTRAGESGVYTSQSGRTGISKSEQSPTKFYFVPVYDENADNVANRYIVNEFLSMNGTVKQTIIKDLRPQWSLLYVIKCVFETLGYTFDYTKYDAVPYNIIVIANCSAPSDMASALPHWTLKEFIEQVGKFFGCSFKFSSGTLHVEMIPLSDAYAENLTEIDALDEFSVEVSEDNTVESVGVSNLHYDISDSDAHGTDYIDEETMAQMPIKEYASKSDLLGGYEALDDDEKPNYIFRCPVGDYCQWKFTESEDSSIVYTDLIHINQFADLVRSSDSDDGDSTDNTMDLKIVPVAIRDDTKIDTYYENGRASSPQYYVIMASMEGSENDIFGSPARISNEDSTAQELLEGGIDQTDKADRIEVYFVNFIEIDKQYPSTGQYAGYYLDNVAIPLPFTAYDRYLRVRPNERFSLSMNKDSTNANMAKWHKPFRFDTTTKYTIKFLSSNKVLPVATDIYLIRNKKFMCEKLELEIKDGKVSPLVTGYFYPLG